MSVVCWVLLSVALLGVSKVVHWVEWKAALKEDCWVASKASRWVAHWALLLAEHLGEKWADYSDARTVGLSVGRWADSLAAWKVAPSVERKDEYLVDPMARA